MNAARRGARARRTPIGPLGGATLLAAASGPAAAHPFHDVPLLDDFFFGALLVVGQPAVLSAALATGLAVAIGRADGLVTVGLVVPTAATFGAAAAWLGATLPGVAVPLTGLVMAGVGALAPPLSLAATRLLLFAAVALLALGVLGDGSAAVMPASLFLGVGLALALAVGATAALGGAARRWVKRGWLPIALRSLSAWLFAILVLVGALSLRA